MAHRMSLIVFSFVLLAVRWHASAEDDIVAVFGDPQLFESIQHAVQPASLLQTDLPVTRPPYHTKQGWTFCNFTCAEYVHVKNLTATPGGPLMELDVKLKPVRGVNSTMMQWLWRSLSGKAKYWVNNATYPMYLIFHPVDHVSHKASPLPLRVGTNVSFTEFITARCSYNRNSPDTPITCPSNRIGFVKSTPTAEWEKQFQLDEVYQVSRFNKKQFEFHRWESVLRRTVATVRITWSDTHDGISIRYQQWVGLMLPNKTAAFDESDYAKTVNPIIKQLYLDGAENIDKGNMTQVAWMQALHFIESFDPLKLWLPALWKSRVTP